MTPIKIKTYGDNLERLKKIKAKYDPDNIMPGLLNIS